MRSLLRAGLVDELHPVVVGSGGRLFDQHGLPVPLQFVASKEFSTGVLNLGYRPITELGAHGDVQRRRDDRTVASAPARR